MARPFAPAFLANDPRATAFLPADFSLPAGRARHAERAAGLKVAPAVIAALTAQNSVYRPSAARAANLAALGKPGTTAMVTGQQVGLFLGPLYSVHKAAACIANARAIEAETGRRCVPVFWLQSEDHDFDEVNRCVVLGRDGAPVSFRLTDGPDLSSRVSVKHVVLGPSVRALLDQLAECSGEGLFLEALRRHYQPGVGMVQAFAGLMADVFADEGLVMLDPRDDAMAQQLAPVHERALRDAKPLADALTARSEALEAAGFDVQVHVRPGSPLSFFHPEGPTGPRVRIDAVDERLLRAVTESPLSFSTSALLRPVAQDTLLPTVGYVGGPGEANYFAQLRPVYDAFGVPMPMFVPRARFRVIDARTKARLDQQRAEAPGARAPGREVEQALVSELNRILDRVPQTPELKSALERTRGTIARAASRFALRIDRVERLKHEVETERAQRIDHVLNPLGEPQERVLGLPAFACRHGLDAVKRAIFGGLVPFDPNVKDVFV